MSQIKIAIPTTNRASIIGPTVRDIARQSRLPDQVLIVIADETDVDSDAFADLPFDVLIIRSERGLTNQRNAALARLQTNDVLLFLDDDFLMAPNYLEELERLFETHRDVVMSTGKVLEDGIHGPGLTHDFARQVILASATTNVENTNPVDIYNCYGCNMALRAAPALARGVRFDERLKLYCWLEDIDFSREMAAAGRIVKSDALQGVHLGAKLGRSSGVRLGYSQIANPLYLVRKGTMTMPRALNIMSRNLISNLVKSLKPEPEIDRRGRLVGNLRAFGDLMLRRMRPERILDL